MSFGENFENHEYEDSLKSLWKYVLGSVYAWVSNFFGTQTQ